MTRLGLLTALAAVAIACLPASAASQEDSTAIRVRQRLERLARPPAPDTSSAVAEDTLVLARIPARAPRGQGGGGGQGGDTVLARLLELEGFDPTRYEGKRADFEAADRVLILRGDSAARASVRREGMELTADSLIRFDDAAKRIVAEGHPVFTPQEGDPVESQRIIYDIASERGSAIAAKTRYSSGANWIVTGDLPRVSPEVVYGSHTRFTSCDLEIPHYHFETDQIKIVAGRILVARPVRLYFADVPVAWLPFVAQSLSSGRASGLLPPRFSVNDIVRTSGGYNRRISNVGFYWAMSDFTDATVALDWFSDNFTSVTGAFRYRWLRQFLDGTVNVREYWRSDGQGTELSFDTNHTWEPDERTSLRIDARYASSTDFVRRTSTDPREVTQQIRSSGGLDRRFGWGSMSVSASREEDLSDDEVSMTLPDVSLSLTPITLFAAPRPRAQWYNNVTWSGRTNVRRQITDLPQVGEPALNALDRGTLNGTVTSGFTLGNLGLNQSVSFRRASTFGFPSDSLLPGRAAALATARGAVGTSPLGRALFAPGALPLGAGPFLDLDQETLDWNTSLSYQQTLVGSTTITPNATWSGSSFRADTVAQASSFVAAPSRLSFGATLKSDVYGLYGGMGPFSAIRHKVSPSLTYQWSPETQPTALQRSVFNSRVLQPTNQVSVKLNQTFEAKRRNDAATDSVSTAEAAAGAEPGAAAALAAPGPIPGVDGAPSRQAQEQIVNLLSINTDVVRYDFVEADSTGDFLLGFQTTQIGNSISSDFLRGLSVQVVHDLFRDTDVTGLGPTPDLGARLERSFAPHLARLNLGFSLNQRSSILRGFGLWGGGEDDIEESDPSGDEETGDPFDQRSATDERTVIPGRDDAPGTAAARPRTSDEVGRWNANFSYALNRPRLETLETSQMLQISFNLVPTEKWDLGWRTSYDLERGAFNDHMVSLSRDLHRWQASFDFTKTATGNWAFRFEVSLIDNRDLKFDYKQQNLDLSERRP